MLYRLIREGYTAVLAPRGAAAVDILVADRKSGTPFSVQVKTKTKGQGWRLTRSAEELVDPSLFYCLVDIGRDGELDPPEVFVVPSDVIARHVRIGHARWLSGTKASGEPRKDSDIRQVIDRYPNPRSDMEEFPSGWLQQYKEAWESFS